VGSEGSAGPPSSAVPPLSAGWTAVAVRTKSAASPPRGVELMRPNAESGAPLFDALDPHAARLGDDVERVVDPGGRSRHADLSPLFLQQAPVARASRPVIGGAHPAEVEMPEVTRVHAGQRVRDRFDHVGKGVGRLQRPEEDAGGRGHGIASAWPIPST
jgi:hypothetical protein